ncbi:MAG: IS66 family insertion sequence element accessory protein TnpB [Pirellulales bacterium]
MLSIASGIKIFVYTRDMDMRKGFNALSGIVRSELQSDPMDGHLYLFINRRRDRLKILHFDGGGYWLYYRLLEAGTFEELASSGHESTLQIDATQLAMLLSGVSLKASTRRRKRLALPVDAAPREGAA